MRRILGNALALLLVAACDVPMERTTDALPTPTEKSSLFPPPPSVSVITSLAGPESVLHDPQQDVYFISNLNGGLLDVDGNGFISRVDAQSMSVNLRWIEGGKNGAKLDAPKGMTVVGDTLFVSDVTAVRRFNRRTGAPEGEVALPGATLINDLTSDGTSVYASDTGVKPAPGIRFVSTGTDAIWKITGDRAQKLASGTNLLQPNGLDFHDGALWVVSFRGNRLYRLVDGKRESERELPRGQLDGLVHLEDGTPLVASWVGTAIYRGRNDDFAAILTGVTTPADIGYDAKRKRLLVPRSALNQVTIHAIR